MRQNEETIMIEPKTTIVISAVNLVVGGTLAILRDCLQYLSSIAVDHNLRIIALVHKKELVCYPNIEYIEIPWAKKTWINRLWCEYITMKKLSRQLAPIHLWFSLHDTTPNVIAQKKAVYCHNSFPFYKITRRDLVYNYKIVLFALFSKYIYKTNIYKNNYVIVQQNWFKQEFIRMFKLDPNKIIIAYPTQNEKMQIERAHVTPHQSYTFLFPASANSHKNFELICQAAGRLEKSGIHNFQVWLTVSGTENNYAKWLYKKYHSIDSIKFIGFQSRTDLFNLYNQADCLIFPAKIETWGLPISEFATSGKPMLLSDLPYAHTSATGSVATAFFNPSDPKELQSQMTRLILGDTNFLSAVAPIPTEGYHTQSWAELFGILLK